MKKLTKEWMKNNNACQEAVDAWTKEGCEPDVIKVLNRCMKLDRFDWANWLIVRRMTYKQYVSYAVFAAEQVIKIYEKKYPNDGQPRDAIETAKLCIKSPTAKNKKAARAAAGAAWAAWAAGAAARAAAGAAAWAAGAAAWAARAAAWAAWAAGAAGAAMKKKIIDYGIGLLEGK